MSYSDPETGKPLHAYVSKKKKAADLASTAYAFTLVGIAGILFLILFAAGALPFAVPVHMKILASAVMGTMFLSFLIIGIRSFLGIKSLAADAEKEEREFAEITDWFRSAYPRERLEGEAAEETDEGQRYFSRYEKMQALISEKYEHLEESFLDHIIEALYEEYYHEDS